MEIKRATEFGNDIQAKISELFVEAFEKDLRYFSKDKEKLIKALAHIFVLEYFYVAIIDNEVAGMAVCIDKDHFCINHNKDVLIKYLGTLKGFMLNIIIKYYFNKYPKYPVEMDVKTASIEFVATSANHRKKGVASKIMNHLFALPEYKDYILEVADTNTNAFELYKKLGYKEVCRKKMKFGSKYSGINYFVYMKYSK
jgi:ribosomal protein S18 acetylase RimI-like enzyme